jgi:hypothetical protein
MFFSIIGATVVGLIILAVIVFVLQYIWEGILWIFGMRRKWIVMYRHQGKLTRPFPWLMAAKVCLSWNNTIAGYFVVGGLEVPADPRQPIRRSRHFYG